MQKGAAPVAIVLIVVIIAAVASYFIFNKGITTPSTSDFKPLIFDKYSITLPQGFEWTEVVSSSIDPAFDVCNFNPETVSQEETPCKYVVIKSLNDEESQIIIADTPKWGLGGGGYITTINEKIDLGPKGYEAEFSSIWIAGDVDENGVATSKLILENGNPVLYYVTGCVRPTLCIHMNAMQAEEGNAYADNSWQFDKFKQFVNSLEISSTQKGKQILTKRMKTTEETDTFAIDVSYPEVIQLSDKNKQSEINELISRQVGDYIAYFKNETPQILFEDIKSTFSVTYQIVGETDQILSIEFTMDRYYSGAAHPYAYATVFNYDLKKNKQIFLKDLFQKDSNYLQKLSEIIRKRLNDQFLRQEIQPPQDMLDAGTTPEEENFQNFLLKDKVIEFIFDPYQVAPYAAGPQRVEVSYNELEGILNKD